MRIIEPVRIAEGTRIEASTVGPNVTIDEGAEVRGSVLRHVIVGKNARILDSTVEHSLIGDDAVVTGATRSRFVAARGEIGPAP